MGGPGTRCPVSSPRVATGRLFSVFRWAAIQPLHFWGAVYPVGAGQCYEGEIVARSALGSGLFHGASVPVVLLVLGAAVGAAPAAAETGYPQDPVPPPVHSVSPTEVPGSVSPPYIPPPPGPQPEGDFSDEPGFPQTWRKQAPPVPAPEISLNPNLWPTLPRPERIQHPANSSVVPQPEPEVSGRAVSGEPGPAATASADTPVGSGGTSTAPVADEASEQVRTGPVGAAPATEAGSGSDRLQAPLPAIAMTVTLLVTALGGGAYLWRRKLRMD